MEVLIALFGFVLLARILLGTAFRGAIVLFLLLAGLQLLSRSDPRFAAELTPLLLQLFVVAVGFRFLFKSVLG